MDGDTATDRRWATGAAAITVVVVCALTSACGNSSSSATASPRSVVAASVHGRRYCEVLLVHLGAAGLYADVYNTYPLNDCPSAAWSALDATELAKQNGALAALLNGPRYWLMDSIEKIRTGPVVIKRFGDLAMMLDATVEIGTSVATGEQPYVPHTVNRQASFTFSAGRHVYELVDPAGATWVMQTLSQIKDPTLSEADLPGLASRLTLPAGWTYRARTLTAPLVVRTAGQPAHVLQDSLADSYSEESNG